MIKIYGKIFLTFLFLLFFFSKKLSMKKIYSEVHEHKLEQETGNKPGKLDIKCFLCLKG